MDNTTGILICILTQSVSDSAACGGGSGKLKCSCGADRQCGASAFPGGTGPESTYAPPNLSFDHQEWNGQATSDQSGSGEHLWGLPVLFIKLTSSDWEVDPTELYLSRWASPGLCLCVCVFTHCWGRMTDWVPSHVLCIYSMYSSCYLQEHSSH